MAETFDIFIEPPLKKYNDVVSSAYHALIKLGWKTVKVLCFKDDAMSEHEHVSLNLMLDADSGITSFHKEKQRWIDLASSFNKPGRIELGSDISFFEGINPLEELKELFSRITLPSGTTVVGDIEGRLDQTVGIYKSRVWKPKHLKSSIRLRRFGFFWIDQLTSSQWKALCMLAPNMSKNRLSSVDDTHVVLMWDTPYQYVEASTNLIPLAKKIAKIRIL